LGSGSMAISGFGNTRLTASKAFVAKGDGGLTVSGDLGISAPVLTATSYADVDHPDSTPKASLAQISAGGTLTIAKPANATRPTLTAAYLGGELDFRADAIKHSGSVIVPGGVVSMTATHDIDLGSPALIDTSGTQVAIAGQKIGAGGGQILLSAGTPSGGAPRTTGHL